MKAKAVPGVDPAVRELVEAASSRGIPQIEVANLAGLSKHSVSRWGRGNHEPTIGSLRAALNALGLDIVVVPSGVAARVDNTATSCKGSLP